MINRLLVVLLCLHSQVTAFPRFLSMQHPSASTSPPSTNPRSIQNTNTNTNTNNNNNDDKKNSNPPQSLLQENQQDQAQFIDALASAASSVAGTAMNSMYDKGCVMCEYILEQVDKMIKAQPRMMNGNGYYPGVMDFGGGVQQGNYRIYQGTYLQVAENKHNNGLAKNYRIKGIRNVPAKVENKSPSKSASFADTIKNRRKGTNVRTFGAANGNKRAARNLAAKTQDKEANTNKKDKNDPSNKNNNKNTNTGPKGRFTDDQRQAALNRFTERMRTGVEAKLTASKSLLFNKDSSASQKGGSSKSGKTGKSGMDHLKSVGKSLASVGKKVGKGIVGAAGAVAGMFGGGGRGGRTSRVKVGRHTFKDQDLTEDQVEKDQEFATMYKDFMDAMDDVCFHDLPKDFQQYCKSMYYYGDRVVEMYLHDYDDFEICGKVPMQCTPTWFDEGSKSMWR